MKIYNFDLLAYPHVPMDIPGTPLPSNLFDPVEGCRNYEEHFYEMEHCEQLGFEGVLFNEHHYSAYGTMPSPNLVAAALSQRTSRIKIGVLGNVLPLRHHPVRVAEEYAMVDCMSGGRLIAGFVRGIPPEYLWYNVDPSESRGRFEEAFELIMRAWSEPIWSYHGRFFHLENCATWPRPIQQPPPAHMGRRPQRRIRRMVCTAPYPHRPGVPDRQPDRGYVQLLPQSRRGMRVGKPTPGSSFCAVTSTLVKRTRRHAKQPKPALRYFFTLLDRGFKQTATPEGARVREALYTKKSFNYFREENRQRHDFSLLSWEDLDRVGYIIAGSPDTVARRLNEQMRLVGAEHFMGMFHIGNLPHSKVLASLDLFHKRVMPQLQ